MKINYCSDLHLNYSSKENIDLILKELESPADLLIIAGDLFAKKSATFLAAEKYLNNGSGSLDYKYAKNIVEKQYALINKIYEALENFKNPVIYVPGNHEFHGMKLSDGNKEYKNLFSSNVIFLDNSVVEINNINFVGSTMWYEPVDFKSSSDFHVENFKNDFDLVSFKCKNFLEEYVNESSFVITHMLPTHDCIHPIWKTSQSNVVFVRDMTSLILERKPIAWHYGHTHDPVEDFILGSTKIICNSRGNDDSNLSWKIKTFIL